MLRIAFLSFAAVVTSASVANAASAAVRQACSSDYAAYCSNFKVGTGGLHSCMHSHRKQLTQRCLKALASSGEASAAEVAQYKREMGQN